jgi:hypothetical protein
MAALDVRVGGGKSGLHGNTVPANGRRGRPQGKCHRKQTAMASARKGAGAARVKGCGKSAPRSRRREWQGKPHREQDQIGTTGRAIVRACFRAVVRVGRTRRSATDVPDEWPSPPRGGTEPGLQAVWQSLLCLEATRNRPRAAATLQLHLNRTYHEQIKRGCVKVEALRGSRAGNTRRG